jgi:hypothetical protein
MGIRNDTRYDGDADFGPGGAQDAGAHIPKHNTGMMPGMVFCATRRSLVQEPSSNEASNEPATAGFVVI